MKYQSFVFNNRTKVKMARKTVLIIIPVSL